MTDIAAHWTSREDETMRKYLDENKMELDSVICNYCLIYVRTVTKKWLPDSGYRWIAAR